MFIGPWRINIQHTSCPWLKEIPTHDWWVAHFSKKYISKKAHIITVNLCKQTNETLTSIILALLAPSQHKKPTKPWAHDCMEKMKHIHPPYMVDNWFWILHHMWVDVLHFLHAIMGSWLSWLLVLWWSQEC